MYISTEGLSRSPREQKFKIRIPIPPPHLLASTVVLLFVHSSSNVVFTCHDSGVTVTKCYSKCNMSSCPVAKQLPIILEPNASQMMSKMSAVQDLVYLSECCAFGGSFCVRLRGSLHFRIFRIFFSLNYGTRLCKSLWLLRNLLLEFSFSGLKELLLPSQVKIKSG